MQKELINMEKTAKKRYSTKQFRITILISMLLIFLFPLSTSQELSDLTDNPLILLGGIFIIIFFVSYSLLLKSQLGDNRFVCIIISLSIAGIAAFYLSQTQIAFISTMITLLALVIFLIIFYIFARFAYASAGIGGVIAMAGLFLIALGLIPPSPAIPGWVQALAQIGFYVGIGICILGIIVGIVRGGR